MAPVEQVEHDLRAGAAQLMTVATARTHELAPWAYFTASVDAPLRLECASDYAAAWSRFQLLRQRVYELFAAWQAAAVDATLFKGFAVALQAYPDPVLRFFYDVDVYVEPRNMERAIAALPPGWLFDTVTPSGHEVGSIRSPDLVLAVDLHHSFFPLNAGGRRRAARRTAALLMNRASVSIDGLQLRCLQPLDAVLIGVAVNRGWGMDRWQPKPHDYLDLVYLRDKCSVRPGALLERAQVLGLRRSWQAYSRVCDPATATLDLRHIANSVTARLRNDLAAMADAGTSLHLRKLQAAPAVLSEIMQVLPTLLAVCNALHRGQDGATLVKALLGLAQPLDQRYKAVRAVRWATRLFTPYWRLSGVDPSLLRMFGLFVLLARQGYSVELVRGIALDAGAPPGCCWWIELNDLPLRAFDCGPIAGRHRADQRIGPLAPA